jgi:polyphosphate kinase
VPIDLWIRGICCLRPGVPGLSETIRVRSVLGRFLEHARVYAFGPEDMPRQRVGNPAGAEEPLGQPEAPEIWLGSSDLMHRNLDRRVELLVRVSDPGHEATLRGLLNMAMNDATASWWLDQEGTWTRHYLDSSGEPLHDLQAYLVGQRRGGRPVPEPASGAGSSASKVAKGRPKARQRAENRSRRIPSGHQGGGRPSPGATGVA